MTKIMNTESTAHGPIEVASFYEKVDFETLELCERMHICDRRDGVYRRETWKYCVRDFLRQAARTGKDWTIDI
jgi:hypothetical protein